MSQETEWSGDVSAGAQETAYASPTADDLKAAEGAVAEDWQPGDVILGLYEVKGVLGEGGFGKVYRVRHKGWKIDLAVKTPRLDRLDKTGKENFRSEAETWVNLGLHPHTVSCYYVRDLGGIPRVFAEYVEGGTLSDWIRSRKLYEGGKDEALKRILDVAIQFAWGLHYAHEQGLVHQDVKPGNVMMTPEGVAKVTDFGLAKARGVARSEDGSFGGANILVASGGMTPAYASPEQTSGKPLSRGADIWSWAVSVLEMFTGEVTWMSGSAAADVLEEFLATGSEDASIPDMPEALSDFLRHCFKDNPAKRPLNMLHGAQRLQEIYTSTTGESYSRELAEAAKAIADGLNNRAASLLDLGRQEQAEELWEEALRLQPHHPEGTYNHGLICWRKGLITDQAFVKKMEEMSKSNGINWVAKYLLALVHLERKDTETADMILTEVEELWGGEKGIWEQVDEARAILSSSKSDRSYTKIIQTEARPMLSVALSGDGRYALCAADRELQVWDIEKGICLNTFGSQRRFDDHARPSLSGEGHSEVVTSVCFSPLELFALSGSGDQTLKLWNPNTSGSNSSALESWSRTGVRCVGTFAGHGNHVGRREGVGGRANDWVKSVALSPDGRLAVSGSDDRKVKVWEVPTGRCLNTLDGHSDSVESVCFSPDSLYVLSASWDQTLRLWEARTGLFVRAFAGHTSHVNSVCFSPDGRFALSGSLDRTMKLWDVESGQCKRTFEGHMDSVRSVAFSNDGRYAVSGGGRALSTCVDPSVRLWNVETGRCLRTFDGCQDQVNSVFLLEGGQYVIAGDDSGRLLLQRTGGAAYVAPIALSRVVVSESASESETAYIKNIADARKALENGDVVQVAQLLREARAQPGYERGQEAVEMWTELYRRLPRTSLRGAWEKFSFKHCFEQPRFSYFGKYVLTSGVELWESATGRCLYTFFERDMGTMLGRETEKGWYVLVPMGTRLALHEVETECCLQVFHGHNGPILSGEVSEDGLRVLTGSDDGTARLWDIATGTCLRIFEGHASSVNSVSLGHDGRHAVTGGSDKTVRLWEVETGRCLKVFENESELIKVGFTGDSNRILAGSGSGVSQWDVTTGQCVRTTPITQFLTGYPVQAFSFSPDGRYFLFRSNYKKSTLDVGCKTNLCEVDSGLLLHGFDCINNSGMAFSPDGQHILLGQQNSFELRNLETGEKEEEGENAKYSALSGISSVSFSRDGLRAFIARTDGTVELFVLKGGRWMREIKFRGLTDDGKYALTVDEARTVRLWDTQKGTVWLAFYREHKGPFDRSCQRGGFRLSCEDDGSAQLQEVKTGRLVRTFEGHTAAVNSVSMSSDSRYAITVSEDRTAKLWFLDWVLEDRQPADWDDGARPYLESVLNLAKDVYSEPKITEDDFERLMYRLGCEGYGWLRPAGVRRKLEEMAVEFSKPLPTSEPSLTELTEEAATTKSPWWKRIRKS